ncbi:MAG: hypothetical protein WA705_16625 [Candidatus Ozemobacteraceae bacterium]
MENLDKVKNSLIKIYMALFVFALVLPQFMRSVTGGFVAEIIVAFMFGYIGIKCIFSLRELVVLPISIVVSHLVLQSAPEEKYALGILIISIFLSSLVFIGLGILNYAIRKISGSGAGKD